MKPAFLTAGLLLAGGYSSASAIASIEHSQPIVSAHLYAPITARARIVIAPARAGANQGRFPTISNAAGDALRARGFQIVESVADADMIARVAYSDQAAESGNRVKVAAVMAITLVRASDDRKMWTGRSRVIAEYPTARRPAAGAETLAATELFRNFPVQ